LTPPPGNRRKIFRELNTVALNLWAGTSHDNHLPSVLMIYSKFVPNSFWSYTEACKLVGAKYPAAPRSA
jgi:hypothetical protein